MRHRKRGRVLGRSPSHRKAMLRNLASSLFLTEFEDELADNVPKVKGRVVTTLSKAKEVRPLVEKCITIARHSLGAQEKANELDTTAQRHTEEWRAWRNSQRWRDWNSAIAPVVAARRHALRLLGDKKAVRVLFDEVAPRFSERNGGYTRIVRLATPRLGDAGPRAILEFVGGRDRAGTKSEAPSFEDEAPAAPQAEAETPSESKPAAAGADEGSESASS